MPTLNWLTRREDEQTAGKAPYRLLEPVAELSSGDPAAGNMLIHGDNLDALKALLPFYAGRVKCIYIDPPYNTRSAFTHYDDNLEHSQWLAMIYPRLELLRDLLAEDGSIWVSIDDNEGHYLKVVMDEVFGRGNFVADGDLAERTTLPNQSAAYFGGHTIHLDLRQRSRAIAWTSQSPDERGSNRQDHRADKTSSKLTQESRSTTLGEITPKATLGCNNLAALGDWSTLARTDYLLKHSAETTAPDDLVAYEVGTRTKRQLASALLLASI